MLYRMRYLVGLVCLVAVCVVGMLVCSCTQHRVAREPSPTSHIHLDLHADVDFTMTERATIHRAINALAQQTAGIYEVEITYDLDYSKDTTLFKGRALLVRLEDSEGIPIPDALAVTHYAVDEAPSSFLIMSQLGATLDLKHVVMHELLHAIGLKHVPGDSSLMSSGLCRKVNGKDDCRPIFCFSPSDAAEFCRIAGCRSDDLPHCEWRSP